MPAVWLLVVVLVPFAFFDVWYFINVVITLMLGRIQLRIRQRGVLEEAVIYGLVTTTDVDLMFHMNNARYSRTCDFGSIYLSNSNGLYSTTRKLGGLWTMGASAIRFRRSMQFLSPFRVRTKILCWDDKAFYIEQRIETLKDNFICAIKYCKTHVIHLSPAQVVEATYGQPIDSPEFPPEVTAFIQMNNISSKNLRKSL